MQLASLLNEEPYCTYWDEGHAIFDLPVFKSAEGLCREEKILTWRECASVSFRDNVKKVHDKFDIILDDPAYMLHNVFFQLTHIDPRKFLPINKNYKRDMPVDKINVGIHFRGTDILGADGNHGREIHRPRYYKDSIDIIESEYDNIKYYVCSDDLNFTSYKETIKYLEQKNCLYEKGNIGNHLADFSTLAGCDILVASSSTFIICAGFLGRTNKKIIHSQEWIEKNLNHLPWHRKQDPDDVRRAQLSFDDFWVSLYNGGNEFYKVWRWV